MASWVHAVVNVVVVASAPFDVGARGKDVIVRWSPAEGANVLSERLGLAAAMVRAQSDGKGGRLEAY